MKSYNVALLPSTKHIGESFDTGNIGHTGQRQTQEQKHNITQKTKKMSNTDPT
jgi:hypothetical protein